MTGSEKVYPVPLDVEIGFAADLVVNLREEAFLEVDDLAARSADQMIVRGGFRLEPVEGAAGVYFLHKALIDEDRQVSVDGAKAETGKLRFQLVVKPRCRRVASGRAEYGEEPLPLATVAILFSRRVLFHDPKTIRVWLFYSSGNVLFPYKS